MADPHDPQVSRRYRELGAEEPTHALDEAILATARHATTRRRRWYVPLAAAAVAVAAVGIGLHVQQRDGPEAARTPVEPAEVLRAMKRERQGDTGAADRALEPDIRTVREPASAASRAPIPQTAPAPAARLAEEIAELRRQNRHEEADKLLKELQRQGTDPRGSVP